MRPTKSIESTWPRAAAVPSGSSTTGALRSAQPLELAASTSSSLDAHGRLAARQTLELGQLDRRPHLDADAVAELLARARRRRVDARLG